MSAARAYISQNRLVILTLMLLGGAVYLNALSNAFVSDDIAEIAKNPLISDPLASISTNPFGFIRLLLYWVAHSVGGLNPSYFRSINLLFHLLNICLVFTIINLILNSKRVAFFAAALFAVHPVLVEPVTWISGGSYPQYSFFFLVSFLLYILSRHKPILYWFSVISFWLSFMSHPVMPASLILVFVLYEWIWRNFKKNWPKIIPFFLVVVIYAGLNLAALPEREATLQNVHYKEQGFDNPLVQIPTAITSYLELIFWPKDLTLYHSELLFTPSQFVFKVIIFILFLTGLALAYKKNRFIFFWLSFFLITLTPTLTPFRLNWVVAERYVYLGSVGIFTAVAYLIMWLDNKFGKKSLFFPLLVILIILLSARTITRNIDWKNEDNLWIATGKTSPSNPNTHNNLGDVYGRRGDKEAAIREFQTATQLKPNYADAYHNLANTYAEIGKFNEALENYQKAIEYNPRLWQSYQNMATIYFTLAQSDPAKSQEYYPRAIDYLKQAQSLNPSNLHLRLGLGVVFLAMGQKDQAKAIFDEILKIDPQNQTALAGLREVGK